MACSKTPVTVAHGGGIGPEIMAATLNILETAGIHVWNLARIGAKWIPHDWRAYFSCDFQKLNTDVAVQWFLKLWFCDEFWNCFRGKTDRFSTGQWKVPKTGVFETLRKCLFRPPVQWLVGMHNHNHLLHTDFDKKSWQICVNKF